MTAIDTTTAPATLKAKGTLFGSSPSLAMATALIARFYCCEKEQINLTKVEGPRGKSQWTVKVNDKLMDNVRVFPERGRFHFAKCAD
ncbi:TPA: hypothetical protein VDU83_006805 [Pseudomonas aeruginosa]|nr:hypothetical protein [Pseudomonas aeruginosa]